MNSSYQLELMNDFYDRFDQIHTWLSLVLCLFGLLANLLTATVLTRPTMATVVNKLLTVVAFCDSCLLSIYMVYLVHYKFLIKTICPANQMTFIWALFSLMHADASIVLRAISLWLSVIIAAYRKRLLYSYQPPRYIEDYSKVYKLVILTVCFVMAAAVPIFLGNNIVEEVIPDTEVCDNQTKTIYRVVSSNFLIDDEHSILLKANHFINAALFKLAPCVLLTYYLTLIINLLYKRGRLRQGLLSRGYGKERYGTTTNVVATVCRISYSSSRHRQFNPTTILLGAILTMTILCEFPNALASVLSGLLSEKFFSNVYRNLGDVFDVLSLFNGLTTFIVYCSMSRLFRLTFVGIFFNISSYRGIINRMLKNNNNNYSKDFDEELVDSTFSTAVRSINVSRKGTKDFCCSPPIEQTKFIINDETKLATDNIRPFYI